MNKKKNFNYPMKFLLLVIDIMDKLNLSLFFFLVIIQTSSSFKFINVTDPSLPLIANTANSTLPKLTNVKLTPNGYQLALQWPSYSCSVKKCNPFPKATYTIHGLWPVDLANDVFGCSFHLWGKEKLPENQVNHIRGQLNREWPNWEVKKGNFNFWQDEWRKHGVCQDKWTAAQYFQQALHARSMINSRIRGHKFPTNQITDKDEPVYFALKENNVIPGRFFEKSKFIDSFKGIFDKKIGVSCIKKKAQEKYELTNVLFCFDANMQMKDCHDKCPAYKLNYLTDNGSDHVEE